MSRLPSIQKAQVASHRLPSKAACGRTLSSRRACRTELSSPSYTRAIATASCKSLSWLKHTSTAACKSPAKRKNEAAYSAHYGQTFDFLPSGYTYRSDVDLRARRRSSERPSSNAGLENCWTKAFGLPTALGSSRPFAINQSGRSSF